MSLEERLDRRQDILHTVHALAAEFAKTYPIRDARNEFPYEEVARLKTNGLLTLSIPEAYGGLELPFRDLVECVLTLTLHDPVDYKERLIGEYLLQDKFPPASFIT